MLVNLDTAGRPVKAVIGDNRDVRHVSEQRTSGRWRYDLLAAGVCVTVREIETDRVLLGRMP
jgi:hypothetical protein